MPLLKSTPKHTLVFLFLFTLFTGCSTKNTGYHHPPQLQRPLPTRNTQLQHTSNAQQFVLRLLKQAYAKWQGVAYCYGGSTQEEGVDCSAFVQNIYREAFNIELPRTTHQQIKVGKQVPFTALKAGDLLFFKTGYNTLHTGIYLENGNFMHASSKYGVSLSNMYNPYWRHKFLQARRLLTQ